MKVCVGMEKEVNRTCLRTTGLKCARLDRLGNVGFSNDWPPGVCSMNDNRYEFPYRSHIFVSNRLIDFG